MADWALSNAPLFIHISDASVTAVLPTWRIQARGALHNPRGVTTTIKTDPATIDHKQALIGFTTHADSPKIQAPCT